MKTLVQILQVVVAILFIISGLVKANDPLGLAYKMDEFFQLWSANLAAGHFFAKGLLIVFFSFLNEHNLFLSVAMITLEIFAGVALLAGWKKRFILYFLLALILFFSFLTGYAYLSGKFSNCGCFGDCLPISTLTSFVKDLLLLAAITVLIVGRRYILVRFSNALRTAVVIGYSLLALSLQLYVLSFLPIVDCLPLKTGNNISEQIRPAAGAIPSVYETKLEYENISSHQVKEMSQDEFNRSKIWEDKAWKWKATNTRLIKQGTDIPKLQNFSLVSVSGIDKTQAVLSDSNYILLYWLNPSEKTPIDKDVVATAAAKGVQVYFITTTPSMYAPSTSDNVLVCDGTVFRIGARVNPTIYLLKKGTIIDKWPIGKKDSLIEAVQKLNMRNP